MDVVIRNATMGNVCNVHWRCFRETHRLPPQRLNTGVVEVKLALEPTNVAGWIAKAIAIDPRASAMSYSSVISRRTLCIMISPVVMGCYPAIRPQRGASPAQEIGRRCPGGHMVQLWDTRLGNDDCALHRSTCPSGPGKRGSSVVAVYQKYPSTRGNVRINVSFWV
jgi:hypothetical protein